MYAKQYIFRSISKVCSKIKNKIQGLVSIVGSPIGELYYKEIVNETKAELKKFLEVIDKMDVNFSFNS